MIRHNCLRALVFSLAYALFLTCQAEAREIAVVVNKENPSEEISLTELQRIFKAEKQHWDHEKIHVLMREPGAWEKQIILEKIYQMPEAALSKFWIEKIFRGETASYPSVIGSAAMTLRLVRNMRGAIGFLDAQSADETVKVLKIDGKLPGEEDYPLREGSVP